MDRIIVPLKPGDSGATIANLHEGLEAILAEGLLQTTEHQVATLRRSLTADRASQQFAKATQKLVAMFQKSAGLDTSGSVDSATAEALNAALEKLGRLGRKDPFPPAGGWSISGVIQSPNSAGVGNLDVVVVDKGIGGDRDLARLKSDAAGAWSVRLDLSRLLKERGKTRPDLQAMAYTGKTLLGLSPVAYDATADTVLNIALDAAAAQGLASEYEALTGDLARFAPMPLAALREDGERQDITWLANKSGWDARAVALATLSGRMADQGGGLDAPWYYAALRAGLPTDHEALLRTDPAQMRAAWSQALKTGVIPRALEQDLPRALNSFTRAASESLLDSPPQAGPSTVRQLLPASMANDKDQLKYAMLVTEAGDDFPTLSDALQRSFGKDRAAEIDSAAQLAKLTRNNAPLINRLRKTVGRQIDTSPIAMVEAGLDRAEGWGALIGDDIPDDLPGTDRKDRAARYAETMAAQVRLAFPTAVMSRMVGAGEMPLAAPDNRPAVQKFLSENAARFDLGAEPVGAFVKAQNLKAEPEVLAEVSRLQRVYQITPDAPSMSALLNHGIGSASEVMRYSPSDFSGQFADALGGEATAKKVYDKAAQVHGAVLNVAAAFLSARNAPGVGFRLLNAMIDPMPTPENAGDVLAYGTLESVFGEMDYCACDHCRSVLSPAAYLVDLLMFIDAPSSKVPPGKRNPQEVLLGRRPDIQHLPLTCENTNTPLPYIDLVNETLEYFVAQNLSLDGFEGFTTDPETPEDVLLAGPQNVRTAAYQSLADAVYPPPLPFNRPLELLRRLFGKFDTDLATVMEELRPSDQLDRGAQVYGYRDIRMERLGLSRTDHRLLTQGWPDAGPPDALQTAARLFGMGATAGEPLVRANLTNAKGFADRSGLSYDELAQILRTRFVNPGAELLPMLDRLGVGFGQIAALAAGTLPTLTYAAGADPADYGGDIAAWLKDPARLARIMGLIVLADTDPAATDCDFSTVELRYSDPDATRGTLRLSDFIRLGRFIRLWRKLGWSIDETDAALTALWDAPAPAATDDEATRLATLDAGFRDALPRLGVVVEALAALRLNRSRDLPALLALVGPLGTWGPGSIYARMFLNRPEIAAAFRRDRNGAVLADPAAKLLDHVEDLRGSFGLRAAEVEAAAAALGFDATTLLTLATVSELFRHGWLARRLDLSVEELIALIAATGLQPFGLPDPATPGLLSLTRRVADLRAAGLAPAKALSLIWNRSLAPTDAGGDAGADPGTEPQILSLAHDLRAGLAATEAAFALPPDPDMAAARTLLALAYPAEATGLLMAALDGSTVLSVPYDHNGPSLSAALRAAGRQRIGYDDFGKQLTFAGAMPGSVRDALKAVAGTPAGFAAAIDALHDRSQQMFGPLIDGQPELGPLYESYLTSAAPEPRRLAALLSALLPDLIQRAKSARAVALAATNGAVDPVRAESLLTDAARLPAASDAAKAATTDLLALGAQGLTARFDDGSPGAAPYATRPAALPDFAPGSHPLPNPAGQDAAAVSATLDGWIEGQADGPCQIMLRTNPGATVALTIDGKAIAMADDGNGNFSNADPVTLRAGVPVAIRLSVQKITSRLQLFWRAPGGGRELVPGSCLYPADAVEALRATQLRLLKAAALAEALGLPPGDMAALAGDPALAVAGTGWLGRLAVRGAAAPADAAALTAVLDAALLRAQLRGIALDPDRLALAITALRGADPAKAAQDLAGLLRWDAAHLAALLARFGATAADLARPALLRRVVTGMARTRALGISVDALVATVTNDPDEAATNRLSAALRARFTAADWLTAIKPVNDAMREAQRDALVAFCLFQFGRNPASAHINSVDKLFEYFLMDVGMQSGMLTSRIRNALSSVQTFVERCLMGLEANVSAGSLDPERWAWMKRYRVWEANRKVFLYPENWLDPTLRDDQSPIFRDTVSELLQGDITEERAMRALTGYLTRLDEIAKLEISAIYHEIRGNNETPVVHVVGRTPGGRTDYYYRKREAMIWSPWTRIRLDIKGDPVMPVIWRDRLFLFWIDVIQTPVGGRTPGPGSATTLANTTTQSVAPTSSTPRNYVHIALHWSEMVDGEWQPARSSDPAKPVYLTTVEGVGANVLDRSKLKLSAVNWTNDSLRVSVGYDQLCSFFLYNPYAEPEARGVKEATVFFPARLLETSGSDLSIIYNSKLEKVLAATIENDSAVGPNHTLTSEADSAGFFYQDARNAFYVTTSRSAGLVYLSPAVIGATLGSNVSATAGLVTSWVNAHLAHVIKQPHTPGFGVVDPTPVELKVTEDAHIGRWLGTGGTVKIDGVQIGPKGADITIVKGR